MVSPVRWPRAAAEVEDVLAGSRPPATDDQFELAEIVRTLRLEASRPVPPARNAGEARTQMLAAVAQRAVEQRSSRSGVTRGTTLAAALIAGAGMLVASAAGNTGPAGVIRDSISDLPAAIVRMADSPPAASPDAESQPRPVLAEAEAEDGDQAATPGDRGSAGVAVATQDGDHASDAAGHEVANRSTPTPAPRDRTPVPDAKQLGAVAIGTETVLSPATNSDVAATPRTPETKPQPTPTIRPDTSIARPSNAATPDKPDLSPPVVDDAAGGTLAPASTPTPTLTPTSTPTPTPTKTPPNQATPPTTPVPPSIDPELDPANIQPLLDGDVGADDPDGAIAPTDDEDGR